jgi:transposase
MFYLGIDVALKTHRCALLDAEGEKVGNSFSIDSCQEGFFELLAVLAKRGVPQTDLVIGMEATGHLWENLLGFLEGKGLKTHLLNPFQTNRYRELLSKKAKTDDIDAYVIAGLLRSGEGRCCYVPDDQVQGLRDMVRLRNTYLDNLQTYRRQASALVQVVFPEVFSVVKDPFAKVMRTVLQKYPTASHLAQAHPRHIEKIARTFQGNNFDRTKAEELVQAARNSIYGGKARDSRGKVLASLMTQVAQLEDALDSLDQSISDSLSGPSQNSSSADRLTSIPGVGPKTAAILLAEIGDVYRFHSANHLIGYFGFFPVITESGGRPLAAPKISKRGPKYFRKAVYMAAVAALKHNPELRSLYHRKISQGKAPKQALIVVARKLLTVVYSLLRYNTDYDPRRLSLQPC